MSFGYHIIVIQFFLLLLQIMNMKKSFISIMMLLGTLSVNAQKIEFKADINEMSPMAFPARSGLSGYSFDMRNDSVFVHLPYMGEVYNPTFSNDGLNFEEPYSDLSVESTKKKDGKIIGFIMKHDIVTYKFKITLWDNNRLDIFMQPSNAQICNYMGEWE